MEFSTIYFAGTYGNSGANQLTNLTKVLHQCEDNIYAACSPSNIPQPNQTTIDYCKGLVSTFKTKAKTCIKEKTNSTAACECWTDSALNASANALATDKCKIQSEQAAITKALRLCTGNFSVCRFVASLVASFCLQSVRGRELLSVMLPAGNTRTTV